MTKETIKKMNENIESVDKAEVTRLTAQVADLKAENAALEARIAGMKASFHDIVADFQIERDRWLEWRRASQGKMTTEPSLWDTIQQQFLFLYEYTREDSTELQNLLNAGWRDAHCKLLSDGALLYDLRREVSHVPVLDSETEDADTTLPPEIEAAITEATAPAADAPATESNSGCNSRILSTYPVFFFAGG